MPLLFNQDPTQPRELPALPGGKDTVHVFDKESIMAINAAMAAGRPLLVKGEPGTGKSQLARAAAVVLKRRFVSLTLDARTEVGDLFWTLDAVKRLAEAQVVGALLGLGSSDSKSDAAELKVRVREELDERNFTQPGPLWWGFRPIGAEALLKAQGCPAAAQGWATDSGTVVLLDEIDKADISVPNGLLEALGSGRFVGPGSVGPIEQGKVAPLVIITTNEERTLPHAFLRRCLVLHVALPEEDSALKSLLVDRGAAHFQHLHTAPQADVLALAADLLLKDRKACMRHKRSVPGQAEFLDLVRAVCTLCEDESGRLEFVRSVAPFTFSKHEASSPSEDFG